MRLLTHWLLQGYLSQVGGQVTLAGLQERASQKSKQPAIIEQQPAADVLFAVAAAYQVPVTDVLYRFGLYLTFDSTVEEALPTLLEGCQGARSLLLERLIQLKPLILQDLAGAASLQLEVVECATDLLQLTFQSALLPLPLCSLLLGAIEGTSHRFKTKLGFKQVACQHDGAPHCQIVVRFPIRSETGPGSNAPVSQTRVWQERVIDPWPAVEARGQQRHRMPWSDAAQEAAAAAADELERYMLQLLAFHEDSLAASPSGHAADEAVFSGLTMGEIQQELASRPYTKSYAQRPALLLRALSHLGEEGLAQWSPVLPLAQRSSQRNGSAPDTPTRSYRITKPGRLRLQAWEKLE